MPRVIVLIQALLFNPILWSQERWEIMHRTSDIQIDGFIDDWPEIDGLILNATTPGVKSHGDFSSDSVTVHLQGLWDKKGLYIAISWEDDIWDIKEVPRAEAVWITPDKQRRNRMYFFDNFNFNILKADYDFTLWVSPRVDQGPFLWHRLLEGLRRIETARVNPLLTARFRNDVVTIEMLFYWKDLRIKPKKELTIPLTLLTADSDWPNKPLEYKLEQLKRLEWDGSMLLKAATR